jgi:fibronectin-binding autotransporter adhesin
LASLSVTGNETVGGTLGVTGASTLASLGVTNNVTVGGTFAVTGLETVGGTLGVTGAVTSPTLNATTGFQISGSYGTIGQVLVSTGSGTAFSNANILGQATPASFTTGVGGGTAPSQFGCNIGATCYDNGGQILITTGTGPTAGNIIALNYGATHVNSNCTIWPGSINSALLTGASQVTVAASAGGFGINSGSTPLAGSTTYVWMYTCNFH